MLLLKIHKYRKVASLKKEKVWRRELHLKNMSNASKNRREDLKVNC
jgi:hypothetical protein